jgi:hypothetical protein
MQNITKSDTKQKKQIKLNLINKNNNSDNPDMMSSPEVKILKSTQKINEKNFYTIDDNTETSLTGINNYLFENCEEFLHTQSIHPTDKSWTIADLFIRQYLNNFCDGFGMKNVEAVYYYLLEHKADLIKYNLISKNGWNNSGYPLWSDYNFEKTMDNDNIKIIQKQMVEMNNALREFQEQKAQEEEENRNMLFFEEYRRLGGKYKTIKKYSSLADIFIKHTFELFVMGNCSQYNSRFEAIKAVCKEAKISRIEAYIIFNSLNNIHSYS